MDITLTVYDDSEIEGWESVNPILKADPAYWLTTAFMAGPTSSTQPATEPTTIEDNAKPIAPDYQLANGNNFPNGGQPIAVGAGARWQWYRKLTIPKNPTGGIIIQHVTLTINGAKNAEYWEAMSLPAGVTTVDDIFQRSGNPRQFSGTIVEYGEATFYPGKSVPNGWVPLPETGTFPGSHLAPNSTEYPPGPKLISTMTMNFPPNNGRPTVSTSTTKVAQ